MRRLLLLALCLAPSLAAAVPTFPADWTYRRQIVCDNTGQPHALGPQPCRIDLAAGNFDFTRITDDSTLRVSFDGATTVAHWTEHLDVAGTTGSLWGRVPGVGASLPRVGWLYLGAPGATSTTSRPSEDNWSATSHHSPERSCIEPMVRL